MDGKTLLDPASVKDGGKAPQPEKDPVRSGYTFVGWYLDGAEYDFDAPVTRNITLTAVWEEYAHLDVTLKLKDEAKTPFSFVPKDLKLIVTGPDGFEKAFTVENSRTPEQASDGGYFYQWHDQVSVPAGGRYTVTMSGDTIDGWTCVGAYTKFEINGEMDKTDRTPDSPDLKAYTTAELNPGDRISVNFTNVYRKNPVETCTVTYKPNGGSLSGESTQTVAKGETVTVLDAPTREGYTFTGWKASGSESYAAGALLTVTENITLVAQWEAKTYTVTFDSNGGSAVSSQSVKYGEKAVKPETDPSKEGNDFIGWNLDDAAYDFSTPVTENITLVAQWEAKTYTVTFDSNGGSAVSSQSVKYGEKAVKPETDPSKEGNDFTGWNLGDAAYDFNTPVTKDITLVAQWKKTTPDPTPDPTPNPGGGDDDRDDNGGNDDDTTTIVDNDIPLDDGSGLTDIAENDVPLADIPEADVPLADIPDEDVPLADIFDEDVPLADVPQTGDTTLLWAVTAAASGLALAWLVLAGKKREENAQ